MAYDYMTFPSMKESDTHSIAYLEAKRHRVERMKESIELLNEVLKQMEKEEYEDSKGNKNKSQVVR